MSIAVVIGVSGNIRVMGFLLIGVSSSRTVPKISISRAPQGIGHGEGGIMNLD